MPGMGQRLGAVVLWFGMVSAGCGSDPPPTLELTTQADGSDVKLAMNQQLNLELQTVGPGQFGEPTISSATVRFEGMTFPRAQNPGGPKQLYEFRAVGDGTAVVTIPHDNAAGPAPATAPFTLTLECCPR